jgi:hypothetical protein
MTRTGITAIDPRPGRSPRDREGLLQTLRIPRDERATFKRRLRALVANGRWSRSGHRFGLPDRMNLIGPGVHNLALCLVELEAGADEGS